MLNEKSVSGHVAVIGAGVMGTGIAAHLANIGWTVLLLDRVLEDAGSDSKSRNRLAQDGLDRAVKYRPPQFAIPDYARRVTTGNTKDHLNLLGRADWIVEAAAEDLQVKQRILKDVSQVASDTTVISSNTSGLSLSAMAAGCPAGFRSRFLGTHFFNPPRYMKPLELIPTGETDSELIEGFARFADRVLGKKVIRAKDTPGFISTRLGMYSLIKTLEIAVWLGMTVEQADYLTGLLIGRPKSGSFRLADVIGLDITARIIDNLKDSLPDDKAYQSIEIPEIMRRLIAEGRTGVKAGAGFYKREKNGEILSLDLSTGDYRPRREPTPVPREIEELPLRERIARLLSDWDDPQLLQIDRLVIDGLSYMWDVTPRVADRIVDVDDAIMGGFGWELGPFHILDAQSELSGEPAIIEGLGNRAPIDRCYRNEAGKHFYYDFQTGRMAPLPRPADVIVLKDLKKAGKIVEESGAASMLDLGEGILGLEWRSKMNVLDSGIVQFMDRARERAEREVRALVIGGSGDNFSAGFDLGFFIENIERSDWEAIDSTINELQQTFLRLKYSTVPVVAAVYGYTLGAGSEAMVHCAGVQAAFESYVGLPESNVGLIPAAGGTTEMTLRAYRDVPTRTILERSDPYPSLRPLWENLRLAKFSSSAPEARELGYLSEGDGISIHPDRLLFEAKERANSLAGDHRPPESQSILAMGEDGLARFRWEVHLLRRGEQITAHDAKIADRLAYILCGGELVHPIEVTEQYLLDLEREAFLSLCGVPETLARIKHTLATGKPLRN